MHIRNLFRRLTAPLILSLFFGCAIHDNTAEMWTDIPEMAAYAEQFNAQQSIHRVKVVFKEQPGRELLKGQVIPDLVIDRGLDSVKYNSLLSDLSFLFDEKKGVLKKEWFYPSLLNLGFRGNQLLSIPLSFNLPVLYYNRNGAAAGEELVLLDQEEIQRRSRDFTSSASADFPVRGFSPLWSGEYVYSLAQLKGVRFHETDTGVPAWNREILIETVKEANEWIAEENGGRDGETGFAEKYLYQPAHKLINQGRILYSYTNTREFYQIPPGERSSLRIHWVSRGTEVPACDDIFFAAIPRKGEDKSSAGAFLSWLLRHDTQKELLESSQYKRIRGFGIARGFSSLILVNELDFPLFYPALLGILPSEKQILFPENLPAEWNIIKNEVVGKWLSSEMQNPSSTSSLDVQIREWYNQNRN